MSFKFETFETSIERQLLIAGAIYHDNKTYREIGEIVGLGKERVRQIYAKFTRRCMRSRHSRENGGYVRSEMRIGYDMLDEAWIPIDKQLAEYNIKVKCIDGTRWSRDRRIGEAKPGSLPTTGWRSLTHGVLMMRKTIGEHGVEYWECNAHFYNQCLEHPERQGGINGIYTSLPKKAK